jgi:hypothetical protein
MPLPLPLYSPSILSPKPRPTVPQPKQILSGYTHKKREDRISQRVWYENITYPAEVNQALNLRGPVQLR